MRKSREGPELFRFNPVGAREQIATLVVFLLLLASLQPALGVAEYSLQVGASGDASSANSEGFRVEIRTHSYPVNTPDRDFFVVGGFLMDGGFIEFGYALLPAGNYCNTGEASRGLSFACSYGSETVNASQPVWYWEHSPNATGGVSYGLGSLGILQTNGTWHVYSILPDPSKGWAFEIDGQEVASGHLPLSYSHGRVFVVAAKTTTSSTLAPLGPVEFRNLAFLMPDGWHPVNFLYAIVSCGVGAKCLPIPYGVSLIAPNHIIAGTSVARPQDGELLWVGTTQPPALGMTIVLSVLERLKSYGLLVVTTLAAMLLLLVVRRMRKRTKAG